MFNHEPSPWSHWKHAKYEEGKINNIYINSWLQNLYYTDPISYTPSSERGRE